MDVDDCIAYYEEEALGDFYAYNDLNEHFTMKISYGCDPRFYNEQGHEVEDPGLVWFAS